MSRQTLSTYLRRGIERLCRSMGIADEASFDYRRIIELAGDGLIILNPETRRIEEANPAMAEMSACERAELIGEPLDEFLRGDGPYAASRAAEVLEEVREHGMRRLEWKLPRKDGSEYWAELTVRPIELGPGTRILALCRDMTRQKANTERLEELSRRLVDLQEEERRRIAIELHDEIGQMLTALTMALDLDEGSLSRADRTRLGEARSMVDDLAERVRALTLDLRPSQLDDLGLVPALFAFFKRYRQTTGVDVEFHHGAVESASLPARIGTSAYRIVRESLTNVARHAQMDRAQVNLWGEDGWLAIRIRDEGVGFDPASVGTEIGTRGLSGMRKRVKLLGGVMQIDSSVGEGTRISVRLPLASSGKEPGTRS